LSFLSAFSIAFISLFPVVNPVGGAPIFLSLTRGYPASAQRILARKIALYGFVLLSISLLFGSEILSFFGITLAMMQVAGGLVLASMGWNLLNQPVDDHSEKPLPATLEDALKHAFFPLTLPITVGPGCISIAITIGAHLRHQAGPGLEHGYPRHLIAAMAGMFAVCLLVAVCYGRADRLVRVLGESGTSIMTLLSAFILLAIGVQITWNGLSSAVHQVLARTAS
jgi:multiple antibiotic resistance protein